MTPNHGGALDRRSIERIIDVIVVPILLIIALLLPPASLGQRLFGREGTTISAKSGGLVAGPAGAQVTVPADALTHNTRVAYTSFQTEAMAGGQSDHRLAASVIDADVPTVKADSDEGLAAAQLPTDVVVYEPLYSIKVLRKEVPAFAQVTVPLPYELAQVEMADLYVWDGDSWNWQPSHADGDLLYLDTELTQLPALLAVAEAQPVVPDIAVGVTDPAEADGSSLIDSVIVSGLTIGDGCTIAGSASPAPGVSSLALISNTLSGVVRSDLVDNMLIDESLCSNHVSAIVDAIDSAGFKGADLDYQGVDPSLRAEFSAFVQELAVALHMQGLGLAVRVGAPATDGEHWDTGAYDWQAIGAAADQVRIPALTDPAAYVAGGDMERMVAWAVGEINRAKIDLLSTAEARDVSDAGVTLLTYGEALGILASNVQAEQLESVIEPGDKLSFAASSDGTDTGIAFDADAQVYYFDYQAEDGTLHTVYLSTGSSTKRQMQYVGRYGLGGYTVDGALSTQADDEVLAVIETHNQEETAVSGPQFAIVWTVTDPEGVVGKEIVPLENPSWTWTAPNNPGGYVIGITVSDDGGQTEAVPVAELDVTVPTPVVTPTPEPTATPEVAPTPEPGEELSLQSEFVEDITVPDNTQFDKGETFTKTWRLLNSGDTDWPDDTVLVFDSGENMAATDEISVGSVAAGEEVDISIEMTAPDKDARVKSVWKLQTTYGTFVRGATMYVQIIAGDATVAAASSAPVTSAGNVGGYFGYGIQAHVDGDMEQIFGAINDIGFGWVKQQVEWFRYNPAPGQYDWGHLDQIVNTAQAHGVKVLFSVVKAPSWARPAGDTDQGPPSDPATYADFMREMAARYKGRVQAYEIWNEQNLYYEWGGRGGKLNAGKYVELLAAAYNAIKSVDPSAVVISGALTPTGLTDWDIAVDDATYLEAMYQAGLKNYCDAIGAHPSGYNNPPDATWDTWNDPSASSFKGHRSFFFRSTIEQYRNIMVKYGDSGKRIWATEFGWATVDGLGVGPAEGYGYAADNTEAEQAEFIVRAYQMGKSWGFMGPMFLWNLNFAPVSGRADEKAAFGIVREDWSARPAYSALKNMAK